MVGKNFTHTVLLVAILAAPGVVAAQDDSPGWTGITDPESVIASRQGLMTEMERLMRPIDSYTVDEPIDPETIRSAAVTIAQILLATPHLFPPTTNLYDDKAEIPVTIALPPIWKDFETFESLALAASAAADSLSSASDHDALVAGALGLRAACDACHTLYLLPYKPSTVTSEDLDFDFDSFFDDLDESSESAEQ
jgi:cytochrome c556